MPSSGLTAIATTGATATVLIAPSKDQIQYVDVVNEGAAPGFFYVGQQGPWRIPAASAATAPVSRSVKLSQPIENPGVTIVRDGSTDMGGVYGNVT